MTNNSLQSGHSKLVHWGYVSKAESTRHLIDAIRRVLEGKLYLSETANERLLGRALGNGPHAVNTPMETLSDRELQVFELLGEGETVRTIAVKLKLSPKTIESYRENLKTKLGLDSGAQLLRHAVQWVLEQRQ